jgi:hypothetical protein
MCEWIFGLAGCTTQHFPAGSLIILQTALNLQMKAKIFTFSCYDGRRGLGVAPG